MLTIEVKVNGQLIGHCYCLNMTPKIKQPETEVIGTAMIDKFSIDEYGEDCEYDVTYYRVGNKKTKQFKITHNKSDGADVLVQKVFNKLCSS